MRLVTKFAEKPIGSTQKDNGVKRMKKILVVEDDVMMNSGLCYNLELDNYEAVPAYNAVSAVEDIKKEFFDLTVLDVNLPDGSGFNLFKKIKEIQDVPVVFLTACDLENDVIAGYDLGADDYITKPFNINIFRKKVSAIIRRCDKQVNDNVYADGSIIIDFNKLTVTKNDQSIMLTPTECRMLKMFTASPNIVLTRQTLLEKLWDCDGSFVDEHALTVSINRLRSKIESDDRKYIKTVYGMGYLWIGDKE